MTSIPNASAAQRIVRIAPAELSPAPLAEVIARGLNEATSSGAHAVVLVLPALGERSVDGVRDLHHALRCFPRPVVAEVYGRHGDAGITLCAAVDLVVAARSAVFESDGASDGTLEEVWLRYLPVRAAKWLAYNAGPIDANEALRLGFVNAVAEDSEVAGMAHRLAARICFVPGDVLEVKKRANDFRLRWT